MPVFQGKKRKEPDYFISGLDKFRMFRSGDYKIVRMNGGDWELYNIRKDPTELENLAADFPEKTEALSRHYHRVNNEFVETLASQDN